MYTTSLHQPGGLVGRARCQGLERGIDWAGWGGHGGPGLSERKHCTEREREGGGGGSARARLFLGSKHSMAPILDARRRR
jgi:hypothetical protein